MKAILVIDIEEDVDIKTLRADFEVYGDVRIKPYYQFRKGVELKPMPEKKHGRLIDADAYLKKVCTYKETGCGSCRFQIVCPQDEPTINDSLDEIMGETE